MIKQVIGIYKILNVTNGKFYIGSSKDIVSRWKRHIWQFTKDKHPNKHMQQAYNNSLPENWSYSILEVCSLDELLITEQKYLDVIDFKTNYNIATKAKGGGSNISSKPVYVLNLKGKVLKECVSGAEAKRFIGRANILDYSTINTSSINQSKYRIVTPDFYISNKKEILSWKSVLNLYKETIYLNSLRGIKVSKGDKIYRFRTMKEVGIFLKIGGEAVRLILLKDIKLHKKTGYYLERF